MNSLDPFSIQLLIKAGYRTVDICRQVKRGVFSQFCDDSAIEQPTGGF
jgi:hypothetical protein